LRKQQEVVDQAIEHLTIVHYNDLNSSVVAVGHVSKRFGDAVGHVKGLRKQVQEIRENLANASVGGNDGTKLSDAKNDIMNHVNNIRKQIESHDDEDSDDGGTKNGAGYYQAHPLGGKSLRELWLKKLECEAVLSLLQKLEIIRETPGAFDALVHSQPCRIGAAVVLLADALKTIFNDDVSQIQALHKIMEQLMTRKQKAEEILWETLQDVLYLRTGNSDSTMNSGDGAGLDGINKSIHHLDLDMDGSVSSASKRGLSARNASFSHQRTKKHFFVSSNNHRRGRDGEYSDSDDSDSDIDTMSASTEDRSKKSGGPSTGGKRVIRPKNTQGVSSAMLEEPRHSSAFANFFGHQGRLLPKAMLDSELNVGVDELRCLENWSNIHNGNTAYSSFSSDATLVLPRYTDPVSALRILIEALAKLSRLDDVERHVSENVEAELRRIAQLEQAKTLSKLEKHRSKTGASIHRRNMAINTGIDVAEERLKIFKSHLKSLLRAFGTVMLRLTYLTQILRHRIVSDPTIMTPSYPTPSSALHSILVAAHVTMQREVKGFLHGVLNENESIKSSLQNNRMITSSMMDGVLNPASKSVSSDEQGIFSLGIISDASLASSVREKYSQNLSLASRSSVMRMTAEEYVLQVLCPRTGVVPQVRHALAFRKSIEAWSKECDELKKELATVTQEDVSSPTYNATTEETAIVYLDGVAKNTLLPMLQDAAEQGTASVLERPDAFDPISNVGLYNTSVKGRKLKVEMCAACQGLYSSTGPLFVALQRLPKGGEMYAPLVAGLEHYILTFISRVKARVSLLCDGTTAFQLLEDKNSRISTALSHDMESRKPFSRLLSSYFDDDSLGLTPNVETPTANRSSIKPIEPSSTDTKSRNDDNRIQKSRKLDAVLESGTTLQREKECFEKEVFNLEELLKFTNPNYGKDIYWCKEDNFLKAASLAHSLLKVSSQLEKRLKPKKAVYGKSYHSPRTLRDSIKNIRMHGIRVAKFCRIEVLLQTVKRMSTLYASSALSAKDAIRLPSCVNDLGEYLSSTSDLLREYGGNKIAAFSLSSLEQYIPFFLMETARIIAIGDGVARGFRITLNGSEALERSCSVLYRDLKGATSFENSFWDDEVAEDAFDRAAKYICLMELDMNELVSYYRNNRNEFPDDDYKVMFTMTGPRRKGDIYMYDASKS